MHKCFRRYGLACAAALWLTACIPIPYKPSATLTSDPAPPPTREWLVSASHDDQTDLLTKKIRKKDRQFDVVTIEDVAAVALPKGDVKLDDLLAPETRVRLQRQYGISYLVLIGVVSHRDISSVGGFAPLLGLGTEKTEATISVSVVDLSLGESISGMSATAQGRTTGAIYGFWGLYTLPMLDTSTYEAIAQGIVQLIRSGSPAGRVSIIIANAYKKVAVGAAAPDSSVPE